MRQRDRQSGFGTRALLLIVPVVAVLAATGLVVYQRHNKPSSASNSAATGQTQTTTQPQSAATQSAQATTYQGWNTYNDTGYAAASGISIKYPSDWKIYIPDVKSPGHVKSIGNATHPTAVI